MMTSSELPVPAIYKLPARHLGQGHVLYVILRSRSVLRTEHTYVQFSQPWMQDQSSRRKTDDEAKPKLVLDRAEERKGGETSQLALARCGMRGVLGRERSRARTVEKWRVKTKFCSIYKVHCYG